MSTASRGFVVALLFSTVAAAGLPALAQTAVPAVITDAGRADEPGDHGSRDDDRAGNALKLTRDVAASLQLCEVGDRATKLKLVETPLLRYTNPIAGEFHAHLYVWEKDGRPEAAAAIAKWYKPKSALHLEFHSLSVGPLTADYREETIWRPQQAGVTFNAIPGAPLPARAELARLREMRQMARDFRARVKALNRGNVDEDLRLLAQPVYRYHSKNPAVLDGAIFSFVRGTDPELLLLIEARQVAGGFAWMYACAPLNSFEFHAYHRESEVWQKPQIAPPWQNTRDPTKPYLVYLLPGNM